ncbi:hypothetical protein T440DRAFT_518937 [Plenodomus tracheiphilus IPT5]|uniref:Uncharacterized protein n=1 Tax=Plenodomus tracheiphilus IPT5 TaxID=1408161 RepID=A0A6A7B5X0_9PLEO|nr:hypothetical protein T440DRAFT_518937 [Plenodomus tracheiphilus IPT5]
MPTLTSTPILDAVLRQPRQPYDFGPAAPSLNLSFPPHANMTAVELLTFLPNVLQNADIIYRLVSNGGTRRLFSVIVNTHRLLLVRWSENTCGATLYKAMNEAGFEGWTVKIHDNWHKAKKANWNAENLDISGCLRPGQISEEQPAAPDVPFKSLAVDVKQMPRGHDALDLTRMVQYSVRKPHEVWLYPRDYSALLEHLGGPTTVAPQHHDREVFQRWLNVELPATNSTLTLLGSQSARNRQQFTIVQDQTLAPSMQSTMRMPEPANRSESTTRAFGRRPSNTGKRMGRPRKYVGTRQNVNGEVERGTGLRNGTYTRAAATYVAPPEIRTEPQDRVIELAFRIEGITNGGTAFSPYAFGGPRNLPPYRSLERVNRPDQKDVSEWAENLRWALKQRGCFGQLAQAGTWNESPEHMELIAKIRREQMWASYELVGHVAEEQYEEEQNLRLQNESGRPRG